MNTFSIGGTVRFAWGLFTKRPWIFIGASAVLFVVNWILGASIDSLEKGGLAIVGVLINIVAGTFIGMGATAFYLKAHDAIDTVAIRDLWHPEKFWKYLGASILYGLSMLVVIAPFILAFVLIFGAALFSPATTVAELKIRFAEVGGVALSVLGLGFLVAAYASAALMFSTYSVIDRALRPVAAWKESLRITKGSRLRILGFMLIALVMNMLGAIAFLVGLLVTIPLTMIGFMHIYRTLSGSHTSIPSEAPALQA